MSERECVAEVLGPRLSKGEARPLENQAKRHYRAAGRNLARFAADLRRLQDGEAHLTRGFSSFGAYAEHTFDGLSAANAKKISVQGAVLLALERHDRITLVDQASPPPGVTGLRALAAVLSAHGEDTMLAIYDKAALLRPGRAVVDTTVNLAVRGLLTPPVTLDAPAAAQDVAAGGHDDAQADDSDSDESEDRDEDPEAVHELHDRLIEIRRALDDLGAVTSELAAIRGRQQAQRIVDDLIEEIHELPDALAAAIASQHDATGVER
jgi:ribosomal protein L12E/L44/L45/RPP1/RPP2